MCIRVWLKSILALLLMVILSVISSAFACIVFTERSILFADDSMMMCDLDDFVTEPEPLLSSLETPLSHNLPSSEYKDNYWEQWALPNKDNPILTKKHNSQYFGLGFWLPESFQSEENSIGSEEWFRNHGLMFSFGFGDKHDDSPRIRFDYRWHVQHDPDWRMQIEVPF